MLYISRMLPSSFALLLLPPPRVFRSLSVPPFVSLFDRARSTIRDPFRSVLCCTTAVDVMFLLIFFFFIVCETTRERVSIVAVCLVVVPPFP